METLILLAEEHRNYYGKKPLGHDGFRSSSPSKTFKQINCRTFQTGVGLLQRPPKRTSSTPIITKGVQSPPSPKSVLPSVDCVSRTSPILIPNSKGSRIRSSEFVDERRRRSLSYSSELWAGPTYSNSPPPTSVPIPKFSLRQKRTVSLTFPPPDLDVVDLPQVAKSAPVSPTSFGDNPFHSIVSATMTLRRMLNLETADE